LFSKRELYSPKEDSKKPQAILKRLLIVAWMCIHGHNEEG